MSGVRCGVAPDVCRPPSGFGGLHGNGNGEGLAREVPSMRNAAVLDETFVRAVASAVPEGSVAANAPLAERTTFRIGGPAQLLVSPGTLAEAASVWALAKEAGVPVRALGEGSDLLVADGGVAGVVLAMTDRLGAVRVEGERLFAEAGATNAAVSEAACAAGLAGYEFACGIPGSIGGAAIMNAGAYGGQFCDVAESVLCADDGGNLLWIPADEAGWGYRKSRMDDEGLLVLGAALSLSPDDPGLVRDRMDELTRRRESKQPLTLPSAGSTFKRPEGHFAGKLVEDAGLRGHRIGGAQVSDVHAGFVVNAGGATAADVVALIEHVRAVVDERFGVLLEPEVRFWGFGEGDGR